MEAHCCRANSPAGTRRTLHLLPKERCGEGVPPRDTSERIFYLVGIHQALLALLPDDPSLPGWLRRPSETPVSPGSSLLRQMLLGRVADLYPVHFYLVGASKRTPQRELGS
jgi:hypothetical protein